MRKEYLTQYVEVLARLARLTPNVYNTENLRGLHLPQRCVMSILDIWVRSRDRPKISLVILFTLWKLFLLCIALLSPGPGYDTSTKLLHPKPSLPGTIAESGWGLSARLRSLVRWDAIYYIEIARRGYSWEQEWAFGWGFTKFMALASKGESCCHCVRDFD